MQQPLFEIEAKGAVVETRRPTLVRDLFADAASVIVVLCTLVWYGSLALTCLALPASTPDEGEPPFGPGIFMLMGFILTAIPALIAAVTAVALAGWRRSRLGWGSLIAYVAGIVLVPAVMSVWNWLASRAGIS